ncbi:MAG: hypothetical protein HY042_03310 [Spirochaetia bacterium]|nr:hypothetical protein [Spirochaetia bacterium]
MIHLHIEDLNTVETSVQTWMDFIEFSMKSDFYKLALERTGNVESAASLTLLNSYLRTFEESERERAVQDVEVFYGYAKGFISELAPYRYHKEGYKPDVRAAFMGKIRALLAAQMSEGQVKDRERYTFIRTIVHFCSSLDYIIKVHDKYKQFLFREIPQVRGKTPG